MTKTVRIGLYPGTFDPPTNGHVDIIARAAKLSLAGKDLTAYSRETVQMFYKDACAADYSIEPLEDAA